MILSARRQQGRSGQSRLRYLAGPLEGAGCPLAVPTAGLLGAGCSGLGLGLLVPALLDRIEGLVWSLPLVVTLPSA